MTEMIERAARAMVAPQMAKAIAACLYLGDKREAFLDSIWQEAVPFVCAVLEAIREPTSDMKMAGHWANDEISDFAAGDVYRAMIGAALGESP